MLTNIFQTKENDLIPRESESNKESMKENIEQNFEKKHLFVDSDRLKKNESEQVSNFRYVEPIKRVVSA